MTSGFTRDISSEGLFVVSSSLPPVGTAITLEVSLPAIEFDTPGLDLRFEGVVVRSEESTEGGGLAVAGHFKPNFAKEELRQ